MTLLDATTTLIDAAKTYAPENDRVIARAVKRMEKRLAILQQRAVQYRARNQTNAWLYGVALYGGRRAKHRVIADRPEAVIPCKACQHEITFDEFLTAADYTGHGHVRQITCPACGVVMAPEAQEVAA
jgi:hypothetical protein